EAERRQPSEAPRSPWPRLSYRQTSSTYASAIYNYNAPCYVALAQAIEHVLHPRDHVRLAPIAPTKEDQARSIRPGKGKQPRIIQIGGDHGAFILRRACQDFRIGSTIQTQGGA